MKRHGQIILSWIAFILALGIAEVIIFRVLYPFLVNVLSWTGIPRDHLSRSVRFWIIMFGIFVVAMAYCLFLTKTVVGRKSIQWFIDANKTIFQKNK